MKDENEVKRVIEFYENRTNNEKAIQSKYLLTFENEFKVVQEKEFSDSEKITYLQKRFEALQGIVKLSDFVPCGADGLPFGILADYTSKCDAGSCFIGDDYNCICHATFEAEYQEAKEAVIFEGWELKDGINEYHIKNNGIELIFSKESNSIYLISNSCFMLSISTYYDLAKETISNPLKFRK